MLQQPTLTKMSSVHKNLERERERELCRAQEELSGDSLEGELADDAGPHLFFCSVVLPAFIFWVPLEGPSLDLFSLAPPPLLFVLLMAGDVARGLFFLSISLWFLAVRSSEILPSRSGGFEQREPRREAEKPFLAGHGGSNGDYPSTAARGTRHDMITNPVTTSPTPGIITVPASNPITVLPGPAVTIPVVNPMPFPPTNPITTPITVPATIPAPPQPPGVVPINPVTTPTLPMPPPLTNPVTTYPFPPPSTIPFAPGIGTAPGTVPVAPAVAGQAWCVAKTGTPDATLQIALDYACGVGGADCSAIQQTGGCYNPNTLRDHASYAFNSYYQKNPSPMSCDFGGTATLVNTNPSTATCTYPSTSSAAPAFNTYNPTASTPTIPTGTPINPTGTGTVFGSNTPMGPANPAGTTSTSSSSSLSAGLPLLLCLLVVSFEVTRWPL